MYGPSVKILTLSFFRVSIFLSADFRLAAVLSA